ncbi:hypothetical protein [Brevibacillus brevis]|uniref:hypothetical protein n=1 Tax=Brevibacillus brevis TaxID=1393 RepID=UPI0025A5FC8C|nr:hypothetical protein [Brevibacillus brevis]WJQ81972.1 hypothetical protein QN310_02065 [Brevibacillus brevis]
MPTPKKPAPQDADSAKAYTLLGAGRSFYQSDTPGTLGGYRPRKIYGPILLDKRPAFFCHRSFHRFCRCSLIRLRPIPIPIYVFLRCQFDDSSRVFAQQLRHFSFGLRIEW